MTFETWIAAVETELTRRTGNGDLYVEGYLSEFRSLFAAGRSVSDAVQIALTW
jgi:hypothetical protein